MKKEELTKRFTYHAPKEEQAHRYVLIRENAHAMASTICELCPESREQSLAIMKLEESVMWANASIARNE